MNFKEYAESKGYTEDTLKGIDRAIYIDLQNGYLIDSHPTFKWLDSQCRKNQRGWYVCNHCQYPPCETIPEIKSHFEINHGDLINEYHKQNEERRKNSGTNMPPAGLR